MAARARRPQDPRFLRRPRGRGPGLRPSALAGRARARRRARWHSRPTRCPWRCASARPRAWCRSRAWASTRCSWINSGAEANENALKLAFRMTGRTQAVALEQGLHGRTAAAGAVTWGALEKWYGFPRTPVRRDASRRATTRPRSRAVIDRDTAAVIVEPVQGVGGAYEVGRPMLQALRQRCDETGARADLRRGAVRRGPHRRAVRRELLRRDARHDHRGQGAGQRLPGVGAAAVARASPARAASIDDMGTTFGGGPMACAVAEAVIDTIESESLLANVRTRRAYIRAHCMVGPVTGMQGAGLPARPADLASGQGGAGRAAREGTSSPAPAATRTCCGCCRPTSSNEGHVDQLRDALAQMPRMKRFLDLADFTRDEILDLLRARAAAAGQPAAARRSPGKILGLRVLQPVAAHARVVPGRHGAPRRQLVRDHARARAPGSSRRG